MSSSRSAWLNFGLLALCSFVSLSVLNFHSRSVAADTKINLKASDSQWRIILPPLKGKIFKLKWPEGITVPILDRTIEISGNYQRPKWSLVINRQAVIPDSKGDFTVRIPLGPTPVPSETLSIIAISPLGDIEEAKAALVDPTLARLAEQARQARQAQAKDARLIAERSARANPTSRWTFATGLGVSRVAYQQGQGTLFTTKLNELGITIKLGAEYALVPNQWKTGVSFFGTLLPLSTDLPGTKFQYFGANARVSYLFASRSSWRFSLAAGYYYSTIFNATDQFGYKDVNGPQLYPAVTKTFSNGSYAVGYFKFSPVSNGLSVLSLANREIAFGGGYHFPFKGRITLGVTLDIAMLKLGVADPIDPTLTNTSTSTSYSLGLALGF